MKINQLKGGAVLSYVSIFLTNIVGLLLTPFIIRSLGQAEYGLYTMIGALVGYLSVLDFGLNSTIVTFVAKYQAEKDKKGEENFLAHSYLIYFFISLVVVLIGLVLYFNLDSLYNETLTVDQLNKAKRMVMILIFNLAIVLPGGAFLGICSGYEEFVLPKFINICRYILRSITLVAILLKGGDSVSIVILDTIMNLIIIAFNGIVVFKKLKVRIKLHALEIPLLKTMLGFSIWIFVFALVHQLRWQFGQLVLGLFYSTSLIAVYAVGTTLGNYYGAFSGAISGVFLPRAIQMTVKNVPVDQMTDMFIKISRILLIVLFYILGGFVLIGKDFIYFWVGDDYQEAYYYTILIMIGLTPILTQGFANNLLLAKNLLAFRGILLLSLTVIGAIIGFFMAKYYGITPLIVTTVIFMLLERILIIPYYKKHASLDMKRYYIKIAPLVLVPVISVILLEIINYYLPNRNIIVLMGNMLFYSVLYFFVMARFNTDYEITLIKSLVNKVLGLTNISKFKMK